MNGLAGDCSLVRKRSSLKHRVHAQLMAFGHRCPVSGLFGAHGRALLDRLEFPDPWRDGVLAAVAMIDDLDVQIADIDRPRRSMSADLAVEALQRVREPHLLHCADGGA